MTRQKIVNLFYMYDNVLYEKGMERLIYLPPADPRGKRNIFEGVIGIGGNACKETVNLQRVSLPDTVKLVGYQGVEKCFVLREICMSENCTFIG